MNRLLLTVLPVFAIAGVLSFVNNGGLAIDDGADHAFGQGHIEVLLYDNQGNLKDRAENHNLLVEEGLETVWDLAFPDINLNSNATDSTFSFIEIGSGNTSPTSSDTGIETAIGGCARQQDGTVTGGGNGTLVWAYVSVSFSGATCADSSVSEAIITNSLTGGEVLGRGIFSDINFGASDTLTVNYNVTFADDKS